VLSDVLSGALIDISVESLIIGMRDDVGIEKLDEVLINVLTSEAVDIDMLVGAGIIVLVASAVIDLRFAVWLGAWAAVDTNDVTIITASGIGVGMLADVDANEFAAGMADLTFIVPTPLTDSAPFC